MAKKKNNKVKKDKKKYIKKVKNRHHGAQISGYHPAQGNLQPIIVNNHPAVQAAIPPEIIANNYLVRREEGLVPVNNNPQRNQDFFNVNNQWMEFNRQQLGNLNQLHQQHQEQVKLQYKKPVTKELKPLKSNLEPKKAVGRPKKSEAKSKPANPDFNPSNNVGKDILGNFISDFDDNDKSIYKFKSEFDDDDLDRMNNNELPKAALKSNIKPIIRSNITPKKSDFDMDFGLDDYYDNNQTPFELHSNNIVDTPIDQTPLHILRTNKTDNPNEAAENTIDEIYNMALGNKDTMQSTLKKTVGRPKISEDESKRREIEKRDKIIKPVGRPKLSEDETNRRENEHINIEVGKKMSSMLLNLEGRELARVKKEKADQVKANFKSKLTAKTKKNILPDHFNNPDNNNFSHPNKEQNIENQQIKSSLASVLNKFS